MFLLQAINEVNNTIQSTYNVNISVTPLRRVYHIYIQYFDKSLTLNEAAENIYGVLFDNGLIKG